MENCQNAVTTKSPGIFPMTSLNTECTPKSYAFGRLDGRHILTDFKVEILNSKFNGSESHLQKAFNKF